MPRITVILHRGNERPKSTRFWLAAIKTISDALQKAQSELDIPNSRKIFVDGLEIKPHEEKTRLLANISTIDVSAEALPSESRVISIPE